MSKWNKAYWADLGERVGSSALGGVLTLLPLDALVDLNAGIAWTVVGVPAATSLVKGLLVNLKSDSASASLVAVDSYDGSNYP